MGMHTPGAEGTGLDPLDSFVALPSLSTLPSQVGQTSHLPCHTMAVAQVHRAQVPAPARETAAVGIGNPSFHSPLRVRPVQSLLEEHSWGRRSGSAG